MVYLHETGLPYKQYTATYHMFADSDEELHKFAKKIGIKKKWFQDHNTLKHYDVFGSKYHKALELGAIEVGTVFLSSMILSKIQPASKELVERMEKLRKQPSPTLEQVKTQMEASARIRNETYSNRKIKEG